MATGDGQLLTIPEIRVYNKPYDNFRRQRSGRCGRASDAVAGHSSDLERDSSSTDAASCRAACETLGRLAYYFDRQEGCKHWISALTDDVTGIPSSTGDNDVCWIADDSDALDYYAYQSYWNGMDTTEAKKDAAESAKDQA